MARNQEKAQSMLNRWTAMKRGYVLGARPKDPKRCNKLTNCLRWRSQILKQIIQKVTLIQSVSIGEHKIRDLNEEINNAIREKAKWEERIVELNGPDYRAKTQLFDEDGEEVLFIDDYYYFGSSKLLPEVQEIIKRNKYKPKRKVTKEDLYKGIDIEYYGYVNNEYDLIKAEKENEERERTKQIEDWNRIQKKKDEMEIDDMKEKIEINLETLPDLQQIEKMLLDKRKRDVLKRYCK